MVMGGDEVAMVIAFLVVCMLVCFSLGYEAYDRASSEDDLAFGFAYFLLGSISFCFLWMEVFK